MDLSFKNTGGIKSPLDVRDYQLNLIAGTAITTLPQSCIIDVTKLPVDMQNQLGACVGHAAEKAQQKNELQESGKIVNLSPRFVYAICKCLDGIQDQGTYPRLAAQVMHDYGVSTETTVPNNTLLDHETYVYQRKLENIPQSAYTEATKYKVAGYAFSPITEDGIKQAIYYSNVKRQGTIMLLEVGDTFWTDVSGNSTWDASKILPIRPPTTITSGHEVMPYGYEYVNGRLKIHFFNSWSIAWADSGKGWFWFDVWQKYIQEILTFIDIDDVPAKTFTKDLFYGMTDPEVLSLQKLLNKMGFTVATSGTGSPGKETSYFGALTQNAVKKLQIAYKISPVQGYVGVLTRQVLNSQ